MNAATGRMGSRDGAVTQVMRYRSPLRLFFAAFAVSLLVFFLAGTDRASAKPFFVYFGTYTGGESKGIYVSRFDNATGKLSAPALAAESVNPSFIAIAPDHRSLFTVNETEQFNGQAGGAVSAFTLDSATGKLAFLNQQPSGGTDPCHIIADPSGKYVLVANYTSGSVAVFPVETNGSLGSATSVIQHHGSSVNRERQAGPHAHCVAMDAANHRVFICDLGLDKVMIYHLDETSGTLAPDEVPWAGLKPGSGPRHITFSPDGRFAYVLSEMGGTLTAFAYNPEHGALNEFQTVSLLPKDFHGKNTSAEVALLPSGRFIYASNRGDDSIAVFAVDEASGRLGLVERESSHGQTPRCFAIDPTGQYLIAANQNSDNVVVFRINAQTGKLTWTGQSIEVGKPVSVAFVPIDAATP
ncbi:MAG TPA: lactonase family protein [Candidatus Sulfopaludibacter sp.]|nr:lactonase family protein [Candidatus Sulfopaludibacter sp.]